MASHFTKQDSDTQLFARETLQGLDRNRLARARILLIGLGAIGSNILQNLALLGVGHVDLVDMDELDPSNFTRSPTARRAALESTSKPLPKAREAALAFLQQSYAEQPVARYAVERIEALGLGPFRDATVCVSAVDSFEVRGSICDSARLCGTPLVETGFWGSEGHISVFPNDDSEAACFRCWIPTGRGRAPCSVYAAAVASEGKVPATQTIAALTAAYASDAIVSAVHGTFPLAGKALTFDVHSGQSRILTITRNRKCPGEHQSYGPIVDINVRASECVAEILEAAKAVSESPRLLLPETFTESAPCERCGARVVVNQLWRDITKAPRCKSCPETAPAKTALLKNVTRVGVDDPLARMRARRLGIAAATLLKVEDVESQVTHVVQLAGTSADLFIEKRRKSSLESTPNIDANE